MEMSTDVSLLRTAQSLLTGRTIKQDKFDEFIYADEGLFERNMYITKHKTHLSNP